MRILRATPWLIPALAAVAAFPAAAPGEYLVPPGNSAATQYTETIPSSRGPKNSEREGSREGRAPAKVLGKRTVRRLERQGPEGVAVAELTAETAPAVAVPQASPEPEEKASEDRQSGQGRSERSADAVAIGSPPGGSSGIAAVLAQATGVSFSGGIGALLPLTIIGAIAWSITYGWRRRTRATSRPL